MNKIDNKEIKALAARWECLAERSYERTKYKTKENYKIGRVREKC